MTTHDMIREWLKENGYDGLYSDQCACKQDDLFPCGGEYIQDCKAGYFSKCNPDCDHEGYEPDDPDCWHIQSNKPETDTEKK